MMQGIQVVSEGIILSIHVVPGAKRQQLIGLWGENAFKIAISAPPVDDKANRALIEFLSFSLKIPKRNILLVSGNTGRDKRIKIVGDASQLEKEMEEWIRKSLTGKK